MKTELKHPRPQRMSEKIICDCCGAALSILEQDSSICENCLAALEVMP